jgi:hypothetical protein
MLYNDETSASMIYESDIWRSLKQLRGTFMNQKTINQVRNYLRVLQLARLT